MEYPRHCICGHAVGEHEDRCDVATCGCRRDRFYALESALDLAAEERLTQANAAPHRLRLVPRRSDAPVLS
jgi:hypothetical protein